MVSWTLDAEPVMRAHLPCALLPMLLVLVGCTLIGGAKTGRVFRTGHDHDTAGDTAGETDADADGDADTDADGDADTDSACAGWDAEWARLEEQVLTIANDYRAAGYDCYEGRFGATYPLAMDERLRCAARLHSLDMGERDYFDHTTPDGVDFQARIEEQGYTSWAAIGENIAAGNSTASATVRQWMTSTEGHCGNIMSATFEDLGVGVAHVPGSRYSWYWTQDFGAEF